MRCFCWAEHLNPSLHLCGQTTFIRGLNVFGLQRIDPTHPVPEGSIEGQPCLSETMGRAAVSWGLVALLLCTLLSTPFSQVLLDDTPTVGHSTTSNLVLSFSNGPSQGDDVTGTVALTFSTTGAGTLESIHLEISQSGSGWTTLVNLTETPWMYPFDTTDVDNGTYTVRATGWDSDASDYTNATTGTFDIVNQVPVITTFTVLNPQSGDGSSLESRAWFNLEATGTLAFRWGAQDDDLRQATLTNVPGPGTPTTDGPSNLAYGWDWSSGNLSEGTWAPRLTVSDNSGLSNTTTLFLGIDRTAPSMGSVTVGSGQTWQASTSVTLSGLLTNADDGQGSGVDSVDYRRADDTEWTSTSNDSITLLFEEGIHDLTFRATDRVGNTGGNTTVTVRVDETVPSALGWLVDELTTSRTGPANVTLLASDEASGVDNTSTTIQFGFDSNGVGETPDLTGRWLSMGANGATGQVQLSNWATKSRQHLMLRAIITDVAGNEFTTTASSFQILPGLDLFWNNTETNLNRLVVRPGEQTGEVTVTSVLESNQDYGGSVIVRLESAPADRTASVDWTVMETRNLPSGSLADGTETIVWNYTVPNSGQYDLRLVIDHADVIDEYDEGNNQNYLVVTGASLDNPGLVPSFAPSVLALCLAGLIVAHLQRQARD